MKTLFSSLLGVGLAGFLWGCGGDDDGTPTPTPDPVDDSCGLDCEAQTRYGLLLGRCFEYTDDPQGAAQSPPALGAKVLQVETLEGGVKALRVQYLSNGLVRMTDYFTLPSGNLHHVRRVFGTLGSVTYEDSGGDITGVTWLQADLPLPSNVTTNVEAEVVGSVSGAGPTSYRVDVQAAQAAQLTVPAGTYESGMELIFTETPEHGSDPRRFFVPEVGFIRFFSDFSPQPGTAAELRLQAVRDITAGATECGL